MAIFGFCVFNAAGAGGQGRWPGDVVGRVGRVGRCGAADDVVARGDGRGVPREGGHAAGVCLFWGGDGVGGGQAGDQRMAAGRGEDADRRRRDGLIHEALHVGYVDPAVVDQNPVRRAGDGFQPDEPGHLAVSQVTGRGGHQQAFNGKQDRLQFGSRY
jgi:hypothetical protein